MAALLSKRPSPIAWLMTALFVGAIGAGVAILVQLRREARLNAVIYGPCHSPIEAQIRRGLRMLEGRAPERSGLYDLTLPVDADQYRALNKMAVLAVTVFSHSQDDLPASKVEVLHTQDSVVYSLPSIRPQNPIETLPEDSPVAKAVGRYRQDIYVLVPIRLLREPGTLIVVLNKPLNRIELGKFPILLGKELAFITNDPDPQEDPSRLPDPQLVNWLLKGQYCLK